VLLGLLHQVVLVGADDRLAARAIQVSLHETGLPDVLQTRKCTALA
jgi:hypothetical protein